MKKTTEQALLEAIRNLAPKKGGGIDSITISTTIDGKEESVTLTSEDRERIDAEMRRRFPKGSKP